MENLDTLVARYGKTDAQIKELTKWNNRDKEDIKTIMGKMGSDEWISGGYKVKRVISSTETLNEDKLLTLMQHNRELLENTGIIKTKEYVDTEALEEAIYNSLIPVSLIKEMDSCKETKLTVSLRCSKVKEN